MKLLNLICLFVALTVCGTAYAKVETKPTIRKDGVLLKDYSLNNETLALETKGVVAMCPHCVPNCTGTTDLGSDRKDESCAVTKKRTEDIASVNGTYEPKKSENAKEAN